MGLRKDIWRTGILEAPLATLIETSDWSRIPCHFLPDMPRAFQFRADPFGVWHDDMLHIFLEIYDYRDRIGAIEVFVYDRAYTLLRNEVVLREPWHLSYPQVIEAEGSYWMLPEAHRSGTQTLYRAERFPDRWVPEATIDLGGEIAVDATLHFQEGLWWLIYTPVEAAKKAPSRLHVAYARTLHGPWTRHHQNPVRIDPSSARAGGTPVMIDGRLMLPVQDCARTYGGAIRPLWFDELTTKRIKTRAGAALPITATYAPYNEGMHTLSAVGEVTLFDIKRTELSPHGLVIEAGREIRKLRRRLGLS
ncbi:formyl transferase [Asaia sp. W19]|uniref:glucosamine inositolphosphorylceramide transferase family protein n=1 Tax=unclassified Asaia TaxID=2685023 RepID=UPI000F8DDF31|nr:formyl transferase [Asaia sp. W19]RUT26458.1 formyl transferase [Asaia sp. W19]